MAAKLDSGLDFVLVGDEAVIKPRVEQEGISERVEIIHTTDCISNNEEPTIIRSRPNSSIVLAANALKKRDDCVAFVSAGSTGAVLASAIFIVGRITGVGRPGLCPLFPTSDPNVKTMIIDVGANVDCKAEHLLHFAIMGSEYMKSLGVTNPRVALVNIGTEDKKGNELTAATFELLKDSDLNFVGNMEAKDMYSGNYDVLVCDGFVGNVLLKSSEATFKFLSAKIKKAITSGPISTIGALLINGKMKKMKKELSPDNTGGSLFLGARKPVVKAHGSSNAVAFCNAIFVARRAVQNDVNAKIEAAIARNAVKP
jgi:glycerol-3-phosphate acyltransferase PlsX